MRFDLTEGKVPVVTTKKIFLRSIIHELIWFISGSTDIKYLKDNNVSIWDSWTKFAQSTYSNLKPEDFNLPFEVKEVEVLYSYDCGKLEDIEQNGLVIINCGTANTNIATSDAAAIAIP